MVLPMRLLRAPVIAAAFTPTTALAHGGLTILVFPSWLVLGMAFAAFLASRRVPGRTRALALVLVAATWWTGMLWATSGAYGAATADGEDRLLVGTLLLLLAVWLATWAVATARSRIR